MKKILFILTIASFTTLAQITIESSDVSNWFAAGKTTTVYENGQPSTIDIGSTGGSNNWDFSGLQYEYTISSEGIDPATSPHISYFPGANSCRYQSSYYGGEEAQIWEYNTINSNWDNLGSVITVNSQPGNILEIKNTPPAREAVFPFTYNYNRPLTNYTQTIKLNGTQISTFDNSSSLTVDAWGTMTLPGGASFEALRVRYSETSSEGSFIDYSFITKSGAVVNVYSSDSNPPTSGVINADGSSYNGDPTVTEVEQISVLHVNFNLSQNYPNPFNPSTKIQFSLPQTSYVTLEVFNTLGERVGVLASEELSAGTYNYSWDASNLTSGIYFYKLNTGSFTETKKMILLK